MTPGLIIAAPASGSGKTTVTLGLLRHFRRLGVAVASIKIGPDYIDPAFHRAASGRDCPNLDLWAMRNETAAYVCGRAMTDSALVIGEGVMGLFDGATDGSGSTADGSVATGWPVVLVVDAHAQAQSVAALVHGFASHRDDIDIAGVIFNRVGSERHAEILTGAVGPLDVPVLGCIPHESDLALPSRHLGLVQAEEHDGLETFLEAAADLVEKSVDTARVRGLARPGITLDAAKEPPLAPLGQRIAVARDEAFAFVYPHWLDAWRDAGAEILPFSPLADEPPASDADAVFLPGGYPELHAGVLAATRSFLRGLREAAERNALIYGECGGYMILGEGLTDRDGKRHGMAGLLPIETSFAEPRLHLGYRSVELAASGPLQALGTGFRGHEFHYASAVREDTTAPLFQCRDATGVSLGSAGSQRGTVMGSFIHLIDRI